MGDKYLDGTPKAVYYQPEDLTIYERECFFQFIPPLNSIQFNIIKQWYKENTISFALIDEDYIFFTHKIEYDKFLEFWLSMN